MAKSGNSANAFSDVTKLTDALFGAYSMVDPSAVPGLDVPRNILGEAEEFSKRWLARRQDAARSTLTTSAAVIAGGVADPSATLRALSDWQAQSVSRATEDVRDWFEFCNRCAAHFANSTPGGSVPGASSRARQKGRHATPL